MCHASLPPPLHLETQFRCSEDERGREGGEGGGGEGDPHHITSPAVVGDVTSGDVTSGDGRDVWGRSRFESSMATQAYVVKAESVGSQANPPPPLLHL